MLERDIEKVLVTKEQIQEKTKELGQQIARDYEGKNPLVIGILKGAVPFMADLVREMDIHLEMDFMDVSSYGEALVSSGEVKIVTLLDKPEGRVVDMDVDYFGYIVPNEFVVGFGLDYKEDYRHLPYIGVLKPEIYESKD